MSDEEVVNVYEVVNTETGEVKSVPAERLDPTKPLPEDHDEYDIVPEEDQGKRPPGFYCMARKTDNETGEFVGYCQQRAGYGTRHVGIGRCKHHGGSSPVKHGFYSNVQRYNSLGGSIGELYEKYANEDDDPLDITHELALYRAVLEDFINEYYDTREALFEWRDMYAQHHNITPPVIRFPDIHSAYKMLSELTKAVDREKKRQEASAVSLKELFRLMHLMGKVVKDVIEDESLSKKEKINKINDEWRKIVPNK